MRYCPVTLPLPIPEEARVDMSLIKGSATSSKQYWEKTKGVDSRWGKLNKLQNSTIGKIMQLTDNLDKIAALVDPQEAQKYNQLADYLVGCIEGISQSTPFIPVQYNNVPPNVPFFPQPYDITRNINRLN